MKAAAATYEGRLCPACNNTLRYRRDKRCATCHATRKRDYDAEAEKRRITLAAAEFDRCAALRVSSVWAWRGPLKENDE